MWKELSTLWAHRNISQNCSFDPDNSIHEHLLGASHMVPTELSQIESP